MNVYTRSAATFGLAASVILALASTTVGATTPTSAVTVSARVAAVSADSVIVLWRFDLAEDWHVYGGFRNDTGYPPTIHLELPDGWAAEPLRWPVPERHVTAGEILDHVYHDALVLSQTLRRPGRGAPALEIHATVEWLECNQICIPRDTTLVVAVPEQADPEAARELDAVLAALPQPLAAGVVQIESTPDAVEIFAPGATGITAIPGDRGPFLVDLLADGQAAGDRLRLRLRPGTGSAEPLELLLVIDHTQSRRTTGIIVIQ